MDNTSFEADSQSIKKVVPITDGSYSSSSTSPPSSAGSSVAINKTEADVDPWDIVDQEDTQTKWTDLTIPGKIVRILWIAVRLILVLGVLYFFVCSLDVLQDAFQLLGGRSAGSLFSSSLINNPVCGLMIGVLVTVLVQSSSTSTSIVVSMVGSGILTVQQAIPIIMGANIGTTVTNTIVAITQSGDRNIFRRAFAGATVHDMFNWLTVIILLPLEVATHYLYYMTEAMTKNINTNSTDADNPQFLKVITQPLTKLIVEVDKKVITAIAEGTDRQKFTLAKYYCKEKSSDFTIRYNDTSINQTAIDEVNSAMFKWNVKERYNLTDDNETYYSLLSFKEMNDAESTKCTHLFVGSGLPGAALSEAAVGGILLVCSLLSLIGCLLVLVNILNSLLKGPMARIVRRAINADFPGYFAFLTGYAAMLLGAGVTVLVQSSSVFTSALTPLVGIGVVTVERVYPLTLGSNIGTTVTSILAAFTADASMIKYTLQISLCHLFFNISGILIWYPIPFMRKLPIFLAKQLGNITANYRWFAVFYLIILYLLFPLAIFGLSIASPWALLGVAIPVILLVLFIIVVNVLQSKRPLWLPVVLRSWDFLPLPLRSLKPYDDVITMCFRTRLARKMCACKCCNTQIDAQADDDIERAGDEKAASLEKQHSLNSYPDDIKKISETGYTNNSYSNDYSDTIDETTDESGNPKF